MGKSTYPLARKVILIGFFINLALTLIKIIAGLLSNSSAIIADGVHSLSDLSTDLVVLGGLAMASRPVDHNHKYGHGKIETLATSMVGITLLVIGAGLLYKGVSSVYLYFSGQLELLQPGFYALYAAITSIIVKYVLFEYTIRVGKQINSKVVIANARHHISDVYTSLGTLVGIGGAIFLGSFWVFLDPLAAIIISFFILHMGFRITKETLSELIETSLPKEKEKEILHLTKSVNGVYNPHELKTRRIGNQIAIDIHIEVKKSLNIEQAHSIATEVEYLLKEKYGDETFISIHTEPLNFPNNEKHS